MGFKIKNLGTPFRNFSNNVGPLNLTAGVPIAEIYLGTYARIVQNDDDPWNLDDILNHLSEITLTRRGETIQQYETGTDLVALNLFPWFDHIPEYISGGSSGHYQYVKGLTMPTALPIGVSGEFQLTVESGYAAGQTTDYATGEVLSIAEGQGFYAHNYFGYGDDLVNADGTVRKHFHIVKRLYTPAGTGWNSGFDIGTEGDLVGLVIFQTTEQDKDTAKTSTSLYELQLDIGGETVVKADMLTQQGRHGARAGGNASTSFYTQQTMDEIFAQYICLDFARQPWDCRGKTVTLSTNAGTADAIRAYPVYLVDA